MSLASTRHRPASLEQIPAGAILREMLRRFARRLEMLPDGRLTRMDLVLAGIVALLAISSTGFFTTATSIWWEDPDYFSNRLISSLESSMVDPVETGTVEATGEESAMPVPVIAREHKPQPGDYEIVMVFGQEAWLATKTELMRARVGSHLPGLGEVLSIDAATGSVSTDAARLLSKAP